MTVPQAGGISAAEHRAAPAAEAGFRPDIEGLRAVAVLVVVLFHAQVPGFGGGYVGVDIFFVISGFLITGLLWREVSTTGSIRLGAFYGARARRLLPASAFVGVVTAAATVILLSPLQAPSVLYDGIASALYVSNYRFMADGVDYFHAAGLLPPSPFLHYWSLAVEEQFYLAWAPLFLATVWLIRRRRGSGGHGSQLSRRPFVAVLALVATASFGLSYAVTYVAQSAGFYSLPTRAWQLALGGVVALTAGRWRRLAAFPAMSLGWLGIGMILVSCLWLTSTTPYPGIAAVLPTVGAALVIGGGCNTPAGVGRLLSTPAMRAIGRISYSWYLWHWPVLVLTPVALGHSLSLPARLVAVAGAAALAVVTLRCLENPLRFTPTIRNSAGRSLGLGATSTVTAVCVGVSLLAVVPTPVGNGPAVPPPRIAIRPVPTGSAVGTYDAAVDMAYAQVHASVTASAERVAVPSNLNPPLSEAATEERTVYLDGCMRNLFDTGHPDCTVGDRQSNTSVALVGDSHAAMWSPGFQEAAAEHHWKLITMARMGCPFLGLPAWSPFVPGVYTACDEWRAEILTRLRTDPPTLVVLSMWRGYGSGIWQPGFTAYDTVWTDSVMRMVRQLRSYGSEVLVLGPIPDPDMVVPVCLSDHLDDVPACTPERSTAVDMAGIAAEAAAAEAGGGRYADLTDLFCASERCPVIVDNTLVYFDWNHLSHEYARVLAPVLGALAERTIAVGN